MKRKHNLVPIVGAVSDLDVPVMVIRGTLPQAGWHFGWVDQVNALAVGRDADPNLGFTPPLMALRSLPRTNLRNRKEYNCRNESFTLYLAASGGKSSPTERCRGAATR